MLQLASLFLFSYVSLEYLTRETGSELVAAVTNAGGLGCLGGLGYTPKVMRQQIQDIKAHLIDKNAPFGVDLALPQVGGNARKTNVRHLFICDNALFS